MQQQLLKLSVSHLKDANTIRHELHKLPLRVNFQKTLQHNNITIFTFSDAFFLAGNDTYEQSGIITELKIEFREMSLF